MADLFPLWCKQQKLPVPVPEHRFHSVRKHRMDWAWPSQRLALEVEGGVWSKGRHGRGSGIIKDIEKHTLAAEEGWRIIRVVPSTLFTDATAASIRLALRYTTTEMG